MYLERDWGSKVFLFLVFLFFFYLRRDILERENKFVNGWG